MTFEPMTGTDRTHDADHGDDSAPPRRCAFNGVSMMFPDGTHALDDVSFDVSRRRVRHRRRAVGLRQVHAAAHRLRAHQADHAASVERRPRQPRLRVPGRHAAAVAHRAAQRRAARRAGGRAARPSAGDGPQDAIELVGLAGFETKYPKQLSGGMKMRASLARSLVLEPKVFLFDEPFGAVDEITRERLNDELIALFQRKGFAALFITHSINEAVFLSTRVLVMSARPGRIVGEFEVPFAYPRRPTCASSPRSPSSAARSRRVLRGGARMSLTKDSPSTGSLDVIGRLADQQLEERRRAAEGRRARPAHRAHRRATGRSCSWCSSASGTCCRAGLLERSRQAASWCPPRTRS